MSKLTFINKALKISLRMKYYKKKTEITCYPRVTRKMSACKASTRALLNRALIRDPRRRINQSGLCVPQALYRTHSLAGLQHYLAWDVVDYQRLIQPASITLSRQFGTKWQLCCTPEIVSARGLPTGLEYSRVRRLLPTLRNLA